MFLNTFGHMRYGLRNCNILKLTEKDSCLGLLLFSVVQNVLRRQAKAAQQDAIACTW